MDLNANYAENRRRRDVAQREFTERAHGWRFALSADASAWAATWPDPVDASNLRTLVGEADAAGLFLTPEPGTIDTFATPRASYEQA